jgi:hypothetical protein
VCLDAPGQFLNLDMNFGGNRGAIDEDLSGGIHQEAISLGFENLPHRLVISNYRDDDIGLFRHLREPCTQPTAKAALDRILRDEVRHRDFGWDLLDWLLTIDDDVAARVTAALPDMFADLERSYGAGNEAVAADTGSMSDDDRAWGLAPPREYAEILARTFERDWVPRFAARDIVVPR